MPPIRKMLHNFRMGNLASPFQCRDGELNILDQAYVRYDHEGKGEAHGGLIASSMLRLNSVPCGTDRWMADLPSVWLRLVPEVLSRDKRIRMRADTFIHDSPMYGFVHTWLEERAPETYPVSCNAVS